MTNDEENPKSENRSSKKTRKSKHETQIFGFEFFSDFDPRSSFEFRSSEFGFHAPSGPQPLLGFRAPTTNRPADLRCVNKAVCARVPARPSRDNAIEGPGSARVPRAGPGWL